MIQQNAYSEAALKHLSTLVPKNQEVITRLVERLYNDVKNDKSLLVFGSGHSSIFAFELYHRAGGASFVIPLFADYLLPVAGPPVVRVMERTAGAANFLLNRVRPKQGEMLWLASQSGINAAVVDLALDAKSRGLHTVAFTSIAHSSAVKSRHSSGKRLFEVCDDVVDLGGVAGDACLSVKSQDGMDVAMGPLSSLGMILLGNTIVSTACARLEAEGKRCVYTSVNTPAGEGRNKAIEAIAMERDPLLR